ncbi:MAG TPA: hypothetical protein VNJ51_06875 [Candidatus Dormibacteraeota bacterium]|nr:hypothetical protein [Candidatus Dormibacteraeota bacterium]
MTKTTILTCTMAAALIAAGARPALARVPGETTLRGTITAIAGKYDIHVEGKYGHIHDIRLHQGTIINPTGLTLHAGMPVTILGTRQYGVFQANEIDTPYHQYGYVDPMPYYTPWYGGGDMF